MCHMSTNGIKSQRPESVIQVFALPTSVTLCLLSPSLSITGTVRARKPLAMTSKCIIFGLVVIVMLVVTVVADDDDDDDYSCDNLLFWSNAHCPGQSTTWQCLRVQWLIQKRGCGITGLPIG